MRAQLADVETGFEDVGEACAAGDGTFGCSLDHGAVGERVAEWDAELDDVGARVDGGDGHVARGGERGVARSEIDDEAGFVVENYRHS